MNFSPGRQKFSTILFCADLRFFFDLPWYKSCFAKLSDGLSALFFSGSKLDPFTRYLDHPVHNGNLVVKIIVEALDIGIDCVQILKQLKSLCLEMRSC